MSATFDYPRGRLQIRIGIFSVIRHAQLCQSEFKTKKRFYKNLQFPGSIREQRTASHLVFQCNKYAYRWRKDWPDFNGICRNMAGFFRHQKSYVVGSRVKLRWGAVAILKLDWNQSKLGEKPWNVVRVVTFENDVERYNAEQGKRILSKPCQMIWRLRTYVFTQTEYGTPKSASICEWPFTGLRTSIERKTPV